MKTRKLRRVYDHLLERFGPQGWWPTTPRGATRPRYYPGRPDRRLTGNQRWETIVGAILTQNTTWSNAALALEALTSHDSLACDRLARLPHVELAQLIRPARYFNQKARHLQELAAYLARHHGGDVSALLRRPLEALRPELLARRGIGPETADSILLYAAQRPAFVIDAFTRRICVRLGLAAEGVSYDDLQSMFEASMPREVALFNEYHALLVRLAVEHCRVRPVCPACCLRRLCAYGRVAVAAVSQ